MVTSLPAIRDASAEKRSTAASLASPSRPSHPVRLSTNQTTSASADSYRELPQAIAELRRLTEHRSSEVLLRPARLLDQLRKLLLGLAGVRDPQLLVVVVHEQKLVSLRLVAV